MHAAPRLYQRSRVSLGKSLPNCVQSAIKLIINNFLLKRYYIQAAHVMAARNGKDPKELKSLTHTPSGRSYSSTDDSPYLESEEESPHLTASVAASVQLSTTDCTKSQLVAPATLHINEATPQATAQPSHPDFLSAGQRDSNSEPRSGAGAEGK